MVPTPCFQQWLRSCLWTPLLCLGLITGCAEKTDFSDTRTGANAQTAWERLIKQAVRSDGVDYSVFRNRPMVVSQYLKWVSTHGRYSDGWGESKEDKRIAHLANAYNAAVIHAILVHEPTTSVDEIKVGMYQWPGSGLKYGSRYRVDKEWLTLHRLSQVEAVSRYQEPLLWLMFHNGTRDSPPLKWWPSRGLQRDVEKELRSFLASDAGLRRTTTGWAANQLFFDKEKDFLEWHDQPNLCAWMIKYTTKERRKWMEEHVEDCPLEEQLPDRRLNRASP